MAPIRKAKGYVTYLVAILITGLFGLFHKVPPAWAGDATADRNATVFHEMYQVAQAGGNRSLTGMDRSLKAYPSRVQWDTQMPDTDLSKLTAKATQAVFEVVIEKAKAQTDLTAEEAALVVVWEANQRLDDLVIQIEALTKALNGLQAKPTGQ